jgi:hypothetical protein
MGALLAGMNGAHPGYELHVADALWAQQNTNFLPAYLNLVETDYGAGFRQVDFSKSPESVRATINAWIAQQTNDKIQNLLGPAPSRRPRCWCSPTPSTSRAHGSLRSTRPTRSWTTFIFPRSRRSRRR